MLWQMRSGDRSYPVRGTRAPLFLIGWLAGLQLLFFGPITLAQTLDSEILREPPDRLAADARRIGDPVRGAILFYQPYLACTKCHSTGDDAPQKLLGPDLTKPTPVEMRTGLARTDYSTYVVESLLNPSAIIRPGFETVSIVTNDGRQLVGILEEDRPQELLLRTVTDLKGSTVVSKRDVEDRQPNPLSIMPAGLWQQLTSRQQLLDLAAYLLEISEKGPKRALELKPHPSLYAVAPLPEYESKIDHAGLIGAWDDDSYRRGEVIYRRVCANCHGTLDRAGSLPISLRFAEGKFKNGSDPHSMYQTLTRGFGLMVAQTWMVPRQKYDVIHYVRETYLKDRNPSQFVRVDSEYLKKLPPGETLGPEPSNIEPWIAMDYGPSLSGTYEFPEIRSQLEAAGARVPEPNFAYKGVAVRLDPGAGGVSRGSQWMVFDHDTFRVAGAWTRGTEKDGFIDWQGIHFDGQHNAHPHIVGQLLFANAAAPGWAHPETGTFEDPRIVGRDGRKYGPLPRDWARYRGQYHHGSRVILAYAIGDSEILESPGSVESSTIQPGSSPQPAMRRDFEIGQRSHDLVLQVASHPQLDAKLEQQGKIAVVRSTLPANAPEVTELPLRFDGQTWIEVAAGDAFDLKDKDFALAARIRTKSGGTLFCQTSPDEKWVPNGKTWFIRGGRLCFDIGWVGVLTSKRTVNDGKWHDVGMTYESSSGRVRLFVDGKLDAEGTLRPKAALRDSVVRIGFSAPNFPDPSFLQGDLEELRFFQRTLTASEWAPTKGKSSEHEPALADWRLTDRDGKPLILGNTVPNRQSKKYAGEVKRGNAATNAAPPMVLVAGIEPPIAQAGWECADGQLRLRIPAGKERLRFTLWQTSFEQAAVNPKAIVPPGLDSPDLPSLTHGGPSRWPQVVTTEVSLGDSSGPFSVDVLTLPANNPWFAQVRPGGFDFFPDGDRAAVCAWDGDVWLVSGLRNLTAESRLTWQRIGSGLFQPLGLKIVRDQIVVTCRDQLVVLHDLNGDGETDYYECLNHDHQVTEHFHEFAMGLQTDADGNFYYAKSARHALKAVVPHHGTLLRVSADGTRTDILANGFRAANGVCLNPDGSFIVTDQEGHWNPKNRINWVTLDPAGKPKFYGNLFGYHDVTDPSDDAMEPPLCWITNAFDRSPSELLWVTSDAWKPLKNSLLNLSYGYGKIFIVPHEKIEGHWQGGMCELPLPNFPTGIMRGRFHPQDGQLYTCGLFAWAGNATQPGGFYRVRYNGQPIHVPLELHARRDGLSLTLSGEVDPAVAADTSHYVVKTWSLKRSANYGSPHLNERSLTVASVEVSEDRRTLFLKLPDIQPTWCMEVKYSLKTATGAPLEGTIHNTIHAFGPHR